MRADFDILTFDCYGTLIDWEEGIGAAFDRLAREQGRSVDRRRALELYARIEAIVEREAYRSYRQVMDLSAARVAARLDLPIPAERSDFLSHSLQRWRPFPDTVDALRSLARAGYRLGILSNVDDDLLAASLRQLLVDFELLVTAEQVGSYKPSHGHFLEAGRRLGSARWLHVAQSWFHDVRPAIELGLQVVWINRRAEPTPAEPGPAAQFRDLAAFAAELVAGRAGGSHDAGS